MSIQWVMAETTQFSIRIEDELLRTVDNEAEKLYKTRTELIKEAVVKYIEEKHEKTRLKRVAAELWLQGKLHEAELRKALSEEEIKDLQFGKQWIEGAVREILH